VLLVLVLFPVACSGGTPADRTPDRAVAGATTAAAAPPHKHSAPHDGTLVELGEEFAHLELLLDPVSGRLTAYSLDGEAEGAVALTQRQLELTLASVDGKPSSVRATLSGVANELSGETVERTSVFAGIVEPLRSATRFAGTVSRVETKGQVFQAVAFEVPSPVAH